MGTEHEDVCFMWLLMKEQSQQRTILIIRWPRYFALWMLIGSFPSHPSLPNGLMNEVAMVSGMEVMHGLSNIIFPSLRLLCLSTQSANKQRPILCPDLAPFPRRIRQPPGGRLIVLDHMYLRRGTCPQCFCQNHHLWTYISLQDIPTALLLIKELIEKQLKCSNGLILMEFTYLTMFLINLKQLECWNSLSKNQFPCRLGSNT